MLENVSLKTVMFVLVVGFVHTTCGVFSNHPGRSDFIRLQNMKDLGDEKVQNEYSKLAIDDQINVYLFSQCCVEGSPFPFERFLADKGKEKVGAIVRRIDQADGFRTRYLLLVSIGLIDNDCACIRNNLDVMSVLRKNAELRPIESKSGEDKTDARLFKDLLSRIQNRNRE